MSQKTYSSRKRSGVRYKPTKGRGGRSNSGAQRPSASRGAAARKRATEVAGGDHVFAPNPHETEIQKAHASTEGKEIVETAETEGVEEASAEPINDSEKKAVKTVPESAQDGGDEGPVVSKIHTAAAKVIKKVQRIIRSDKTEHEVIINVENLETRVAILEDSKLEEFNIERSDSLRMAGSI